MSTYSLKPKIIGSGLSGLVGQRVVELLSDRFTFVDFSLDGGLDILDYTALRSAYERHLDAVGVLHLAAFTDTHAAWGQRGDRSGLCYRLNVEGTRHMFDLAQRHKQHFVYLSTDFVFDGTKTTAYTEEDAPHPIEWYGETKYLGEKLVIESASAATVARITYPYRTRFDPKADIVRKVIAKLSAGEMVKMFSDQICTHTFIDDIAAALGYLLEHRNAGIYHLVGSSSQSPYEMSRKIAEVFGFDAGLVQPSSLDDFVRSLPSTSRPWQKSLVTSNRKITGLGLTFRTLGEGLLEVKKQRAGARC